MKVYVASSWRNIIQPAVVYHLRQHGHSVYDFKNPPNRSGFSWSEIDPNWESWTNKEYAEALCHPLSEDGFMSDFGAMSDADVCVLVMPCGRSAHVEAGWMQGAGKPTIVLLSEPPSEPELMYKMFPLITSNLADVIEYIGILNSLPK